MRFAVEPLKVTKNESWIGKMVLTRAGIFVGQLVR